MKEYFIRVKDEDKDKEKEKKRRGWIFELVKYLLIVFIIVNFVSLVLFFINPINGPAFWIFSASALISITILVLRPSVIFLSDYKKFRYQVVKDWVTQEGLSHEAKLLLVEILDEEKEKKPKNKISFLVIFGAISISFLQAFLRVFIVRLEIEDPLRFTFLIIGTLVALVLISFIFVLTMNWMYSNLIMKSYKQLSEIQYFMKEIILDETIKRDKFKNGYYGRQMAEQGQRNS